jgi:hypothetical protein
VSPRHDEGRRTAGVGCRDVGGAGLGGSVTIASTWQSRSIGHGMLGARQLADLDWVWPCLQRTGDRWHGDGLGVLSAQQLGHGAQGLGSPARGRCCYVDVRRRRPLLAERERAGLLDARTERCAGADRRDDGWAGVLD